MAPLFWRPKQQRLANDLKTEKRIQILKLLGEGNSIQGTDRLVDSRIAAFKRCVLGT